MVGVPYSSTIRSKVCFWNNSVVSPEERLGDLFPVAALLVDYLSDRPDGLAAVHEPERLDAAFGEADSNSLADTPSGTGDHGSLTFYVHDEKECDTSCQPVPQSF
jgi:hypothetical protein